MTERITIGGFPPVLTRSSPRRKADWYRDYVETLIQRDIRDLANISSLEALPRLLSIAAGQTSRLINITELAAPFQLSRPTIREYLTLLSRIFLLEEIPSWHHKGLKRFQQLVGDSFACGLMLYDGDAVVPFGPSLYAVPISSLWE